MQHKIKIGPKFIPPVGSTTWSGEQKPGKAVIARCLDQRQQHDSAMNEMSLNFMSDTLHEQCFTNATGVKRHS